MNKKLSFVLALLFVSLVAAAQPLKEIEWVPVVNGDLGDGIKLYVDKSTLTTKEDRGSTTSFGMFLAVPSKESKIINSEGDAHMVTSVARFYIVNCKAALSTILFEFYFNPVVFPTKTDLPVAGVDYSNTLRLSPIDTKNPIFNALCSNYI